MDGYFSCKKNIFISKTTAHKYMNKELNLHAVTLNVRRHFVAKGNVKILLTVLLDLQQINPNNAHYYF